METIMNKSITMGLTLSFYCLQLFAVEKSFDLEILETLEKQNQKKDDIEQFLRNNTIPNTLKIKVEKHQIATWKAIGLYSIFSKNLKYNSQLKKFFKNEIRMISEHQPRMKNGGIFCNLIDTPNKNNYLNNLVSDHIDRLLNLLIANTKNEKPTAREIITHRYIANLKAQAENCEYDNHLIGILENAYQEAERDFTTKQKEL